jgi:hypothetical protein
MNHGLDPSVTGETGVARSKERGSTLVLALFVLLLLSSIGLSLLFTTQNELNMSQAGLRSKTAFYLAEAAEEDARTTLFSINGSDEFSDDLLAFAGANGIIEFDPDSLSVSYDSGGNVTGISGYGDDVPLRALTEFGNGWYAAFLTNDAEDGQVSTNDGNDRVMITGFGYGSDGSMETVQAIVRRNSVIPRIPMAAITLLGPSPSFSGGQSNPKEYIGEDCGGSGEAGLYAPLVGTVGAEATTTAEAGIGTDSHFTSGPHIGDETFADLSDTSEPTMISAGFDAINPEWTDCQSLHDIVEEIRAVADVVCTGDDCTLPAASPTRTVFVDGDYSLNEDGEGLLLVTGDLTTHGGITWAGMILVIGTGNYRRNGGGTGTIDGAIVAANIAGPDGVYGTSDDCTGGDEGFGPASFDENGGGSGSTIYCSEVLNLANPVLPYEIVNFRQR